MKKILLLCALGLFIAGATQAQTTTEEAKKSETVVKADKKIDRVTCKELSEKSKSCCKKGSAAKGEASTASATPKKGCCSDAKKSSCQGKAQAAKKEEKPIKKEKDNPDVG